MSRCYTLKKNKGNPRCEQVKGCVWDKKKKCQPKTRKNVKNISMKLDKMMEDLSFIRKEIEELRKTKKNTSPTPTPIMSVNSDNNDDDDDDEYDDGSMNPPEYEEEPESNVNNNSSNVNNNSSNVKYNSPNEDKN